jgi:hypothetical protein
MMLQDLGFEKNDAAAADKFFQLTIVKSVWLKKEKWTKPSLLKYFLVAG